MAALFARHAVSSPADPTPVKVLVHLNLNRSMLPERLLVDHVDVDVARSGFAGINVPVVSTFSPTPIRASLSRYEP
jgi:hypothetical protein